MYQPHEKVIILRWIARILAGLLFLFWGAFFVEHLQEWFVKPLPETPPANVWIGQFLHLAMLLSYLAAMKWDLLGSCLIFGTVALFFSWIGISLTTSTVIYIGVSIVPALLLLIAWRMQSGTTSASQ